MLGPAFTMDKVPGPVCFQDEILIIKSLAIDGLATSTIMACEVTTLAHKSRNYSVKAGNFMSNVFSLVLRVQKFSAVFGTLSANSLREK